MLNITRQVFSEVYDIIFNMQIYNKIPKNFIELIDSNRDTEYKVNIDYTKSLNEQELQKGTRVILSLIYMNYLCGEEERKILLQKDKEELEKIKKEQRKQYNPKDVFKNKREIKNEKKYEEKSIAIVQEKKWYKKIFNLIKGLLGINNK